METPSLTAIIAETLGIEADSISDQTSPHNTASWTSIATMRLFVELEDAFGIKFTVDEMMGCKSVSDIRKILREKNVAFSA